MISTHNPDDDAPGPSTFRWIDKPSNLTVVVPENEQSEDAGVFCASPEEEPLPPPPPSLLYHLAETSPLSSASSDDVHVSKLRFDHERGHFHAVHSMHDGVRVAVKYGTGVRRSEAEALMLVARKAKHVPVPEVLAVYQHRLDDIDRSPLPSPTTDPNVARENTATYIVMTWVDGTPLDSVWFDLTPVEKEHVVADLAPLLAELRRVTPDEPLMARAPRYIGSAARLPCADPVLAGQGPFADTAELNAALLALAAPHVPAASLALAARVLARTTAQAVVFTHGDIHPRNIVVRRRARGGGVEIAGIVDWETAGWYPEYWEYVNIMQLDDAEWANGSWAGYAQGVLEVKYDAEFLLVETLGRMIRESLARG